MSKELMYDRRQFIGTTVVGLAIVELGILNIGNLLPNHSNDHNIPQVKGELRSLQKATGWLNSKPLTENSLKGKVILINFWTYTCINWMRSLPYVKAWSEKYKDKGLVIIGVHAPEFSFEQNVDNVRKSSMEFDVTYPIAIDNNYSIWRSFKNQYWPALYFIDSKGNLRHHQFGEGDYEQSEIKIQEMLADAGFSGINHDLVSVNGHGLEVAADWDNLKSPENYVGHERTENFSSPYGAELGRSRVYTSPYNLKLNHWGVSGVWTFKKECIVLNKPTGRIVYRFHSRDLHLVMGPEGKGNRIRFQVRIDGQIPGTSHGIDINEQGEGIATEQRLYQLIRQPGSIVERQFEIEFLDSELEVFAFTFG